MFEFPNPFEAKTKTIAMAVEEISLDATSDELEKIITRMTMMYNINDYHITYKGEIFQIKFEAPAALKTPIMATLGLQPEEEEKEEDKKTK